MAKSKLRKAVEAMSDATVRFARRRGEVALKIAHVLKELDVSQKELAVKAGIEESYISRIVSGNVNLTLETIARLESALGHEIIHVPLPERKRVSAQAHPREMVVMLQTQLQGGTGTGWTTKRSVFMTASAKTMKISDSRVEHTDYVNLKMLGAKGRARFTAR